MQWAVNVDIMHANGSSTRLWHRGWLTTFQPGLRRLGIVWRKRKMKFQLILVGIWVIVGGRMIRPIVLTIAELSRLLAGMMIGLNVMLSLLVAVIVVVDEVGILRHMRLNDAGDLRILLAWLLLSCRMRGRILRGRRLNDGEVRVWLQRLLMIG